MHELSLFVQLFSKNMALIDLKNIRLSFGGPPLLDGIDLVIRPGERVCLLGRNGEGKTSLIKILHGELQPEAGTIQSRQGLRVGFLEQEVPGGLPGTIFDVVAGGIGRLGKLLSDYHTLSVRLASESEPALTRRLGELQQRLEMEGGWLYNQKIEAAISRLDLAADTPFSSLSAGLKRRALLARALVMQPDLLLLDEPTNHLDITAIAWIEEFLQRFDGGLLFVTHDRRFLQQLATRIVELDRGRLLSWPGTYADYLKRKEAEQAAAETRSAEFDKKLAREEAWIRQGIKARRTRNEGRVRALQKMREERRLRREQQGAARMNIQNAGMSGRVVCEVTQVSFGYADRAIVRDFSTRIMRGDRVGILGPNGAGKTTLMRLLLGELEPWSGTVRRGTSLEVTYFDQLRGQLHAEKTVYDNIADGSSTVTVNGKTRSVYGYLQDFLFAPDRARSPVKSLSGGERNRLLLAKLFARPSNLLCLDEPTNDLDIETLELLEDLLLQYSGTVLLVSHDRAFLNNVVTSTYVFEGDGCVAEYVGGYDDWLRQRPEPVVAEAKPKAAAAPEKRRRPDSAPKKLSFKEKRELEALPAQIEALEAEQQEIYARLADPVFYREAGGAVSTSKKRLEQIEQELPPLYARWEELEERAGGAGDSH
ncbi:ATP-binding cassette domain-containing protein [Thermodesulfobacteriota bacterium]